MNIASYKTIILDCDGVIFDSNRLKVNAARVCLEKQYPTTIVEDFCGYFSAKFGTSRFQLFRDLQSQFLKIDFDQDLFDQHIEQFSQACQLLYKDCPMTEGFENFAKFSMAAEKKLFVASGSFEEELREVFQYRKIDHYFENIFGSPTAKSNIISNIINRTDGPHLMVGDAKADLAAAKENAIDFLFVNDYSIDNYMLDNFQSQKLPYVKNLSELNCE
jgi:phosphoglycolate phosphatase-like HAD superfamily hydrolase